METKLKALLGGWLKWIASLGTAAVSGLVFWILTWVGISDGRTSPLLFGFVVAAVAKFVGWLVATYGPKPTVAPNGKLSTRAAKKSRGRTGNGPNREADLSAADREVTDGSPPIPRYPSAG